MTPRAPKRFLIASSATGLTLAPAAKDAVGNLRRIRLISLHVTASAAGTIKFVSGSEIIGQHAFSTGELVLTLPEADRHGWMQTEAFVDFKLQNAGGLTLNGFGTYEEI